MWQQQFKNDFPECSPGWANCLFKGRWKIHENGDEFCHTCWWALWNWFTLWERKIHMPNNRKIVEQRALHLKKRLRKDSAFLADYKTFMQDMVSKGYVEQVPAEELTCSDGKIWYIPQSWCLHPTKKKICVMFDCGASFQGTSLNAKLLQGPGLISSIIGVVTTFRKEPMIFMADVESMFHQVKVPADDVDLLRFLWWPDGDLNQDPVDFRMLVHLSWSNFFS